MKKILKKSFFVGLFLFALGSIALAQSPVSNEIDSAIIIIEPQSVSSGQSKGQGRSGSGLTLEVNALNQLFDGFEKRKGVESILISSDLLKFSMDCSNVANNTKDLLSKLKEIRIINIKRSIKENNEELAKIFLNGVTDLLSSGMFKRVVKVAEGSESLEMFVTNREVNGALVFLASSKDAISVIVMFGDIDKKVIDAALSGEIKIK